MKNKKSFDKGTFLKAQIGYLCTLVLGGLYDDAIKKIRFINKELKGIKLASSDRSSLNSKAEDDV